MGSGEEGGIGRERGKEGGGKEGEKRGKEEGERITTHQAID